MEHCCRTCMPCLSRLWNCIWPELQYPNTTRPAEIRTVSGDIRIPSPKKKPTQLYAALFDFEARSEEELTVKEGDKLSVIEKRGDYVLAKKLTGSLESGLVPANYVALLRDEFANYKWYYGNINRQKAEKLLLAPQNTSGSFLVRISESHSDEYTISVRNDGKVFHFRVHRTSIGAYYVSDKVSFATLEELVRHYQTHFKSLGVPLVQPCAQPRELFDMEPWERPREEFALQKKLGEGHFGEVWEALWTSENQKVAIKMLKQEDTKQDEFVKEVQALKSLHHPKLIQLLALCSRGEPVYIVTELMTKGSLKSYLSSPEGHVLTTAHLIYMASQVAEGMAYLEDRSIVHRDLAARNILVGDDLVCKVADFGLARIIKVMVCEGDMTSIFAITEDTKQDEFVKEVQALKSLHHPKLIQLLALCSRGEPVYIVTELMTKGSLKSYLSSPEGHVLTTAHLIYMASQVAEGMAYLEDRSIVHRDLAARNILVGDDLVCKVADFGLARIIKDSVYTASRNTKIPVRWTAPEAAIHQRFSVKSDVWSFGVLLYEMMSRGKMPYDGKSNKEVLEILTSGYRLPCPGRCPPNIYHIMMECWHADSAKRPSFHSLHSQLDNIYARIYFKTIEV
ncbi:hypothetical protein ANANG_G00225260 [Anguilla anguilla]|uniref:Tyrosine-protein kinase n=1 Tax=Anguilla anguilla TaxID=7936 RepID=A0A9D3M0Y7_ANGAN|nr:hypothetical protein ANANG_G00225260 [Anguilla anguilla]